MREQERERERGGEGVCLSKSMSVKQDFNDKQQNGSYIYCFHVSLPVRIKAEHQQIRVTKTRL